MKAISIRQPWAWMIINGGKDIENRSWPTRFRGRVLIHAAKGLTLQDWHDAWQFCERGSEIYWVREKAHYTNLRASTIERGGIIGSVEIVDCVMHSKSPWFMGPYGFVLRDPQPLPFFAMRGALGLFDAECSARRVEA